MEIETGPVPAASIIWLHGLGADGHDFVPIVDELDLAPLGDVRFVFPHAPSIPVTINGGYIMPAWYDIRRSDLSIEHDEAGIRRSAKAVACLIEREIMRGMDSRRIVLAGFSQGGAMALHVGLRFPEALAGIAALSAYLLLPEGLAHEMAADKRGLPVFLGHGIDDAVVPFALGDKTRQRLQALGLSVDWHTYPMAHTVCSEEIRHLSAWLHARLAAARAAPRRPPPPCKPSRDK